MLQSELKSFSKRIGRQNGASPSDFLNAAMRLFVAVTSLIFNPIFLIYATNKKSTNHRRTTRRPSGAHGYRISSFEKM